jgi:hypothetical protein
MQHDTDRLAWVTDFDDPVVVAAQNRQRSPALAVAGGAVFGGGGLAALTLLVTALSRPAVEESGASTSAPPTVAPTSSAVESVLPVSRIPTYCGALYGEALTITLEGIGMQLGNEGEGDRHAGSTDPALRELLSGAELDCHWTDGVQGNAALLTRVAEIDSATEAAAIARLEELRFTQLSELGGIRYFVEENSATGATGESHFFREGVWFATRWYEHGQYGYTADMVRSVFD